MKPLIICNVLCLLELKKRDEKKKKIQKQNDKPVQKAHRLHCKRTEQLNIVITLQRNVASRLLQRRRTCCVPPACPYSLRRHCPQSKNLLVSASPYWCERWETFAGGLNKHFNARIVKLHLTRSDGLEIVKVRSSLFYGCWL